MSCCSHQVPVRNRNCYAWVASRLLQLPYGGDFCGQALLGALESCLVFADKGRMPTQDSGFPPTVLSSPASLRESG
ncbi:hypothetical protein SSP24_78610 [Streptomyces spinoverrucosus]|uniref:Uncharacterized protein n=1 Tax=Streptomyces spinoverrucosus TaxID=284043 RepID=A0A4Y3VYU7_9ACTN|nr:hypothetical protein SSP24_78610 [Streptomyces spinoverrucosus]GHB98276.1 hypothetical protein GCM10010397_83410 [Streptomyces spinoverrucosus]